MAYTKYSLTPANNTATPPDGAPEGMLPSAVNDTMRDMMAQIRDCGDGIRDGTYTMTAPKITGGTITGAAFTGNTFTSPVISGGSINNTPIGATTANTGAFTTLSATGVTTVQAGTVSAPAITTTGDTNTGIYFPAADTIAFTEGGVESMRITSAGNVGIGTSSPSFRLEVQSTGGTTSQFERTDGTYVLQLKGSGTTSTGALGMATNDMVILTNGSERMRIDSSGRVGIGTTSPSQLLTVSGGSNPAINVTNTAGPQSNFYCTTTTGVIGTGTNHAFEFHTNNTERMRITSGGGVSIGTTTDAGAGNLFVNNLVGIGANATNGYRLTTQAGTSDNALYRHHKANSGGGTAIATQCTQTATGITTAKTIAGLEEASFIMVRGSDGGGNNFMDLLISQNSGTPTVITSKTLSGSPSARTYTISSFNLQLAMASGTYTTNTMWFQLSAR